MPLRAKLRRTLRRVWRPLGRARRSRGFGVHSPFAFRFITMVLRGRRNTYYSSSQIASLSDNRSHHHQLSLLFRIVCDRQPQALILPDGSLPQTEQSVIVLADSRIQTVVLPTGKAELTPDLIRSGRLLLCLPTLTAELTDIAGSILGSEDSTLILLHVTPRELSELTDGLDHIMIFTNRKSAVIVCRHDLPRQTFEINF